MAAPCQPNSLSLETFALFQLHTCIPASVLCWLYPEEPRTKNYGPVSAFIAGVIKSPPAPLRLKVNQFNKQLFITYNDLSS